MTDEEIRIEEPEDSMPEMGLGDLPEHLGRAIARAGWTKLMPVQSMSLPYLLAGRDLMVQSRTGSGKTGAFLLPILDRIDPEKNACQALVLVPTRELCRQVAAEAEMLAGDEGVRHAAVYGGVGYGQQNEDLRRGAHLVVGTPGRVLDHLLRGNLKLDELEILVMDEADRMLSIGFYPDMKAVQRHLPDNPKLSTFMFSATYTPAVLRLAKEFLNNQDILSLSRDNVHVADVRHMAIRCPRMQKDRCLVRLIELENPSSAIIFCNTKSSVHYLSQVLRNFGYDADELSADLTQKKREQIMALARKGGLKLLVATDVAARGIDIPELSHVFLYEPPDDQEIYIHRAGRTGRAGAAGTAVTLVDTMEELIMERIASFFSIDLEVKEMLEDEDVKAVVAERMTAYLEARLRDKKALEQERLMRFIPMAEELSGSEEGRILLATLLDDRYQELMHKPAGSPAPEQAPKDDTPPDREQNHARPSGNKRRRGRRKPKGPDKGN